MVFVGGAGVISHEEEAQGLDVGQQFLGKGEGFSHKPRHALAQCEIEAFDVVGLALFLGAGKMLLLGHYALVRGVEVGVAETAFVIRRNLVPQALATEGVARAKVPRHHLPGSSAQCDPDPHTVLLLADE